MSGPMAGGFAPVLREVERGLALPIPDRVRILRELEYDLEELCARFVAGGLTEEVARGRAVQALVPDRVTLGTVIDLYYLAAGLETAPELADVLIPK